MNKKQWIQNFFLLIVLLLFMIGIINYIVDPYGLYRVVNIKGFNQQKEGVRNNIRYVKALEIKLRKPKTIIMGSSRVHDSMNPDYIKLKEYQPVYNYGIDMVRIKEIKFYLNHAIKNSNIQNLILGLDFFMFNKYEKLNHTFDASIVNREIDILDLYLKPLFTFISLKKSLSTIKTSYKQVEREEFLLNGYRPGKSVFFGLKSYEKLHLSTNWSFLSSKTSNTLYYAQMAVDKESLDDFQEIINICKKNNITLKLYISPAHANLDGEGIILAGLYNEFEAWKRSLTAISYDNNITLHDFSGYNDITTEEVKTSMDYYWDSSHFTEKIGYLIFDKILSKHSTDNDFGVKLTPNSIEKYLEQNRINREKYYNKNKISLDILHHIYKDALLGKKQNKELIQGIF